MSDIVEYTRQTPFEQKMFKAKWRNKEHHSSNRVDVEIWLKHMIDGEEYYDSLEIIKDKAVNCFFEGTNTSRD